MHPLSRSGASRGAVLAGVVLAVLAAGSAQAAGADPDFVLSIRKQCSAQWEDSSGLQDLAANKISNGLATLKDQADAGNFCANAALAFAYLGALNVPANTGLASYWIEKLAMGGDPRAQTLAFACRFSTAACVKDGPKAAYWLVSAAQSGYGPAEFLLGSLYQKGILVDRNEADAHFWFARAVHGGDAEANAGLSATTAGNADADGVSDAARAMLRTVDISSVEPPDANISAVATRAEDNADYERDLRAFRASYARPKSVGDDACWEERTGNIIGFGHGQVDQLRGALVQIRYQLPGAAATVITTTDASGYTSSHVVGGSPPTDHLTLKKASEVGDCGLITERMTTRSLEQTWDLVGNMFSGMFGGAMIQGGPWQQAQSLLPSGSRT